MPILSLMMMCRVRYYNNSKAEGTLFSFLESMEKNLKNKEKVELLIKFDSNDKQAIDLIGKNYFKQFSFVIKPVVLHRWEGVFSASFVFSHLLTLTNQSSHFIGICTDDCMAHDNWEGIINSLEKEINNNYIIFVSHNHENTETKLKSCSDYRVNTEWHESFLTDPYPIISRKILEICGYYGFGREVDAWPTLLNVILYNKYGVNISKSFGPHQHFIRYNNQTVDLLTDNFEISPSFRGIDFRSNNMEYYFKLVEQSAKSIYLNMKEDGVI